MNIFQRFFSRFKRTIKVIFNRSEYMPCGTLRDNETVSSIAHTVGTNIAKLSPQVIRKDAYGITIKNDRLSRLLAIRPCPEMSTFDFLYRIGSDIVFTSNSFSIIFYNEDFTEVERIQPVTVRDHRMFEDENGNLFLRFIWDYDGKEYTVPYQFVIHIRSRFNKKRFLGTSPDAELKSSTDLLEITYDGIKKVITSSASLRGYLKYNNFIDDDELKKKVKEFQDAYMSAENEGGLAGLDNTMEFKEITQQPRQIPTTQVSFFRDNICRYYNTNEKILSGNFTEAEWNSWYEAVIEPIAIQLSLEFSFKLFSERQRGHGNKIVFTSNRLQYATLQTRATIGKDLFDRGAITINQYLELMYYPPIEGGDVRMISLNYVKVDDQTAYQTGQSGGNDPPPDDGEGDPGKSTSKYIKMLLKGGANE